MHIAIAGNIGSGKTTLTQLLANHYGWKAKFEQVEENPYMNDYYKDLVRWSFNMEVFFLKERFRDMLDIVASKDNVVQDRSIYEGVYVFTANNKDMGNLDDRDFTTYMELFDQMVGVLEYPDLMVYLKASVPHLVANIQKRNRDYEQSMPIEYLENLNKRYDDFIFNKYKGEVLVVEVDDVDFLNSRQQLDDIIASIDARLFGNVSNNK